MTPKRRWFSTALVSGAVVGFLVSLDNTPAVGVLSAKFGASLYVLSGEIIGHIIIVTSGWFIGYKMLGYCKIFAVIAALVLWALAAWVLWGR